MAKSKKRSGRRAQYVIAGILRGISGDLTA